MAIRFLGAARKSERRSAVNDAITTGKTFAAAAMKKVVKPSTRIAVGFSEPGSKKQFIPAGYVNVTSEKAKFVPAGQKKKMLLAWSAGLLFGLLLSRRRRIAMSP